MTPTEQYDAYLRNRPDQVALFTTVAAAFPAERVLYPGSYVDLSPSFVFPSVTYVDTDKRARRMFADVAGVQALVHARQRRSGRADVDFRHADYTGLLEFSDAGFDLLVSLYAGFVSRACTRYLRPNGWLVVNDSHGDASLAHLDPGYALVAALRHRAGGYDLVRSDLDAYFVTKRGGPPTVDELLTRQRGGTYRTEADAYVFEHR